MNKANRDTQVARDFHNATKYISYLDDQSEEQFAMGTLPNVESAIWQEDWSIEPYPFKIYEPLEPIELPREFVPTSMSALAAISKTGVEPEGERIPNLADLARVALLSNGILKEGAHRADGTIIQYRAAGGTGARYHLELYFICGDLPDLSAGIYHYSALDHSFRQLRAGDFRSVVVAASGGDEGLATAPVIVAMSSYFWRNAWRYKARAYRHAFWDAATTYTNILALAASAELPTRLVLGFHDDALNQLLGLDGDHEATLVLCALGREGTVSSDAPEVTPLSIPHKPFSSSEVEFPFIGKLQHASELESGSDAAAWSSSMLARNRSEAAGKLIPLKPISEEDLPAMSVEDLIRRRRSTRNYDTDVAIGFDQFSTLLDRSIRGFAADCLCADAEPLHDHYLIVNNVEGLEPGVYRVHHANQAVELVKAGAFREAATRLAAQQQYAGDAHVDSYYLTELDPILEHFGNRGYRLAQFEAALYGSRLHLGTHTLGLGAVGSTSFDDEVVEFFTPGEDTASYMFVLVFGKRRKKTS